METVFRIVVLCLTTALLALVVKRGNGELAMLLSLAAVTAVLLSLASALEEVVQFLRTLGQQSGLPDELFFPLYKMVGIALVVKVGGELCRDAGESSLAAVLEMGGSVCALLVALPLLQAVLEMLLEFMV
jgi:stage III sporulation protein AD